MIDIPHGEAPRGYRWVYCRFRRVKNSTRILDAWEYGYHCWTFLVKDKTA